MRNKKRPQYVEKMLEEINNYLRQNKIQNHFNNDLFGFIVHYLSEHGWYRGWNTHIDKYLDINGEKKLVKALTGPVNNLSPEEQSEWYIQIW